VQWTLNPPNADVAEPRDTRGTIARSSSDTIALTRIVTDVNCTEATNGCLAPSLRGPAGIVATDEIRLFMDLAATGGVGGAASWVFLQPSGVQGEVERSGDGATARFTLENYNADQHLFFQIGQQSDRFNEDTQTLVIRFTGGESAGDVSVDGIGRQSFTIPISQEDDPTTVTVSDAPAANEGDFARFPVEFIGGIPTRDVEIDWEVVLTGATAEAVDFDRLTGTEMIAIHFPTGLADATTTGAIRVPIAMDDDDEEDRFTLRLTAARGAGGSGISVGADAASTATAVINRLDLSPPRFADADQQPGWTAGQQVLWVKLNEDFIVLPAATGATVSTATAASQTNLALNEGDFVVMDNYGTASSRTIAVTGVTPYPDDTDPSLRLTLASAITADGADGQDGTTVRVFYEHTGGNAIFDTAVERDLAFEGMRNMMTQTDVMLMPADANTTADADGDGIPDAVEARIRGAAGNPFVAVTGAQQPAFAISAFRQIGTPGRVAYSGIREHGVLPHLGISSMPSATTPTAAQTITAYYRSDTFGYDGTYGCAGGQFPANYDAPLAEGGCAAVDWGNIAPSTAHRIAWLAMSADGVWALDTDYDSNLPEQIIRRIPELNMTAQSRFTTGTIVIRASLDADPGETLTLTLTRTPEGGSATEITTTGGPMFEVMSTPTQMVVRWAIAGLANAGGASRLYQPGTNTAAYPSADQYSLGLVRQTRVTRVNVPVPPVLTRAWLSFSNAPTERTQVLRDNGSQNLYVVVENNDDIGAGTTVALSDNDVLSSAMQPQQRFLGGLSAYELVVRVNAGASQMTNTAVIHATVTGGFGGVTTATYRFPVVPASAPLAQQALAAADSDDDGINDNIDDYDNSGHLPVVVDEEAGASPWHHIRPVLRQVHSLRLGEDTVARLARATMNSEVDDYAEYSASSATLSDTGNPAVVYEFEIGPVGYADVTTEGRVGGVAGVIIPLPSSFYDSGAIVRKYPPERPFSEEGDNGYGFAPLQNGACPDDTGDARSLYREDDGTLRRTKRADDACVVLYIVDGGPNDDDRMADGAIRDDNIIVRTPLGGGGGSRSHSGAFGPATLAALLLLLMLAALLKPTRRPPTGSANGPNGASASLNPTRNAHAGGHAANGASGTPAHLLNPARNVHASRQAHPTATSAKAAIRSQRRRRA